MGVVLNTISLVCHSIILYVVLYQYSALGNIIALLFFLTGTILPNLVVYLSSIELSLAFLSLFVDIWKWKSIYFVRICVLLLASFLLGYSILETITESQLHYDGLRRAMDQYAHDVNTKATLDDLQMKLKCCGSRNYTDWYHIPWYVGKVMLPAQGLLTQDGVKVKDDVPFSCCSDTLGIPCIHFGVESYHPVFKYSPGKDLTIWKDGCGKLLIETAQWFHSMLTQFLVLIILAQLHEVLLYFSGDVKSRQYANDKRLVQMKDIANTNVNDEDVQNITVSSKNETTEIQNKINEHEPVEVTQIGAGKIQVINTGDNLEKKQVTFDEKENVVIHDRKLKNLWRKISQTTNSEEVPEKKDNNTKSTLDKRFRNPTFSGIPIDKTKDQPTDHSEPDPDSDVNITETLKDLKNKVFKKIDNQRKYLLQQRAQNLSGKNVSQPTTRYQRPLRYLSNKLRRIQMNPSRRKKGAKTWSNLIATKMKGLKTRYATKATRHDGAQELQTSVVVMNVQPGRDRRFLGQRERYYSSSSETASSRHTGAERSNNRVRVDTVSGKNDPSKTTRPVAYQYFDDSTSDSKSRNQKGRETSGKSPVMASGISASTTGDEMFRKHKREITSNENKLNLKAIARQRTQARKGPRVNFSPNTSPSTSSTYF